MKKLGSILGHRVVLTAVAILLQLGVLLVMMLQFGQYFIPFYWCSVILSSLAVIWIISSNSNGGYKIAWIVLIMAFPVFGGAIYLISRCGRYDRDSRNADPRLQEQCGPYAARGQTRWKRFEI